MPPGPASWPRSRGSTPTAPRRHGASSRRSSAPRAVPTKAAASARGARGEVVHGPAEQPDAPVWEVTNRCGVGGILVREGKAMDSRFAGRLRIGARLQELEVAGERLHYRRLVGEGPEVGWVSMRFDGVQLIERFGGAGARTENGAPVRSVLKDVPPGKAPKAKPSTESRVAQETTRALEGANVWLFTVGDRGDVQPFIALGVQLQRSGCHVRIFGPPRFEAFAGAYRLSFSPGANAFDDFLLGLGGHLDVYEAWQFWLEKELCPATKMVLLEVEAGPPDLLVYNHICINAGLIAWKTHGIRSIMAHVRAEPFFVGNRSSWPEYADFLFVEGQCMGIAGGATPVQDMKWEAWCAYLDSPASLMGASKLLTDALSPDQQVLARQFEFAGNWFLSDQKPVEDPSVFGSDEGLAQIQRFLDAESVPPVYIGWGSTCCSKGPLYMAWLACSALKWSGMRGIIASGAAALSMEIFGEAVHMLSHAHAHIDPQVFAGIHAWALDNVLFVAAVPHEWLFMRCSCTVHHGGAGTTAAALRAGVPTVITPVKSHHFSHGHWVSLLGTGTMTVALDDLSTEHLVWSIHHVTSETRVRARAREVGKSLRREASAARALGAVGEILREVRSGLSRARWEEERARAVHPAAQPWAPMVAPASGPPAPGAAAAASEVWLLFAQGRDDDSFLALAIDLRNAGHAVKLFASAPLRGFATEHGLELTEVCQGQDLWLQRPDSIEGLSHCRDAEVLQEWFEKDLYPATRRILTELEVRRPDLLLFGHLFLNAGLVARKKFGVQSLLVCTCLGVEPFLEPEHCWPQRRDFRRLEEAVVEVATGAAPVRGLCPAEWRGLAVSAEAMVATSGLVLAWLLPERRRAAEGVALTGFCSLQEAPRWGPGAGWSREELAGLEDFVSRGPPPALVAWGEAVCHEPRHMLWLALAGLRLSGLRGIVVAGAARLGESLAREALAESEDPWELRSYAETGVAFAKALPPAWALRRCICAVHHGGTSITAATLRAGLPAVVTPFVGVEQHIHAKMVEALGTGIALENLRTTSHLDLVKSLKALSSNGAAKMAAMDVAKLLRDEQGISAAVAMIYGKLHARAGVG